MDFTNYKFRCSSLGKLMVDSKGTITKKQLELIDILQAKEKRTPKQDITLSELIEKRDAPVELSETTKAYLTEIFVEEVYGRSKELRNKFLEKGLLCEEDSLDLVSKQFDRLLIKNKETLENEFIKGTPDLLVGDDTITDIKTSWDIWTFFNTNGKNKDYYWQLQGYMYLTGRTEANLIYCLVNTPEHLIVQEKSRQAFRLGIDDGSEEMSILEEEIEKNMTFDDIPPNKRVRLYNFKADTEGFKLIGEKVKAARQYLNLLNL